LLQGFRWRAMTSDTFSFCFDTLKLAAGSFICVKGHSR